MNINMSESRIDRRSLHTELVDRLRDMIIEGDLEPGEKIPEKDLCQSFGVSRTPLREALKVLASEGSVVLEPNRGARVNQTSMEELNEIFPIMGALEGLSGELACKYITDDEIVSVRNAHESMMEYYHSKDLPHYFKANQTIHDSILLASRNETLIAQHRMLSSKVRRVRYMANMSAERWAKAVEEHEQIIDALEKRDSKKLAQILRSHVENKLDSIQAWLEK